MTKQYKDGSKPFGDSLAWGNTDAKFARKPANWAVEEAQERTRLRKLGVYQTVKGRYVEVRK